jgi:hypothetical protein
MVVRPSSSANGARTGEPAEPLHLDCKPVASWFGAQALSVTNAILLVSDRALPVKIKASSVCTGISPFDATAAPHNATASPLEDRWSGVVSNLDHMIVKADRLQFKQIH